MSDIFKSADWAREAEEKRRLANDTRQFGYGFARWIDRDEAERLWPPSPVGGDESSAQPQEEVAEAMLKGHGLCPHCGLWGPRHAPNCLLASSA